MEHETSQKSLALLNIKAVIVKTGLSRAVIYTKVGEGTFPIPKRPTPGRIAWIDRDIDQWIASL